MDANDKPKPGQFRELEVLPHVVTRLAHVEAQLSVMMHIQTELLAQLRGTTKEELYQKASEQVHKLENQLLNIWLYDRAEGPIPELNPGWPPAPKQQS